LIGAGDFRDEIEMRFGDGEAITDLFERNGGRGFEFFAAKASAA
jgi:hypothetical protein